MNTVTTRVKKQSFIQIGVFDEKEGGTIFVDFNMIDNGQYWGCTLCGANDEIPHAITKSNAEVIISYKEIGIGFRNFDIDVVRYDEYYDLTLVEKE